MKTDTYITNKINTKNRLNYQLEIFLKTLSDSRFFPIQENPRKIDIFSCKRKLRKIIVKIKKIQKTFPMRDMLYVKLFRIVVFDISKNLYWKINS